MKYLIISFLISCAFNTNAEFLLSSLKGSNNDVGKYLIGATKYLQVLKSKKDDTHIFAITDDKIDANIISSFSIDFKNEQSWAYKNNFECLYKSQPILAFFNKKDVSSIDAFKPIESYIIEENRSIFQRIKNDEVSCRWSPKDSSSFPKIWTIK